MLTKEKPSEVRYYSGKKALELYHTYEKIYEKAEVWDKRVEEMPDAGVEGTDYFTRRYRYDFRGNLLSYEDTLGNLTCYTYDLTGNLVKVTAADGSETTYAYDAQGRKYIFLPLPFRRTDIWSITFKGRQLWN